MPQPMHQMLGAPPTAPPRFQPGITPPQLPPMTSNAPPVPATNVSWANNPQMQFPGNPTLATMKPPEMPQLQPKLFSKQMAENNQLYETMQKQVGQFILLITL